MGDRGHADVSVDTLRMLRWLILQQLCSTESAIETPCVPKRVHKSSTLERNVLEQLVHVTGSRQSGRLHQATQSNAKKAMHLTHRSKDHHRICNLPACTV